MTKEERDSYVCGICGAGSGYDDKPWAVHSRYRSMELKMLEKKAFMICGPCQLELVEHIEARRIKKEYYKVLYKRLPNKITRTDKAKELLLD